MLAREDGRTIFVHTRNKLGDIGEIREEERLTRHSVTHRVGMIVACLAGSASAAGFAHLLRVCFPRSALDRIGNLLRVVQVAETR